MGRKTLGLVGTSFGLVALYLLLTNSFGAAKLISETAKGYVGIIKVLQGR